MSYFQKLESNKLKKESIRSKRRYIIWRVMQQNIKKIRQRQQKLGAVSSPCKLLIRRLWQFLSKIFQNRRRFWFHVNSASLREKDVLEDSADSFLTIGSSDNFSQFLECAAEKKRAIAKTVSVPFQGLQIESEESFNSSQSVHQLKIRTERNWRNTCNTYHSLSLLEVQSEWIRNKQLFFFNPFVQSEWIRW